MPTVIVDANVMISAIRGRSLPLLAGLSERVPVVAPLPQFAETRHVLARQGHGDADRRTREMQEIVAPLPITAYAHMEDKARERLHPRGQSDWPLLAAAMALGGHIWSRDKDLQGAGVPIWFARNVRFIEDE